MTGVGSFVYFNSRVLNICSAEKVGSALSKSSALEWVLAIQFNLFNCLSFFISYFFYVHMFI